LDAPAASGPRGAAQAYAGKDLRRPCHAAIWAAGLSDATLLEKKDWAYDETLHL
jgi:hypothetical protein